MVEHSLGKGEVVCSIHTGSTSLSEEYEHSGRRAAVRRRLVWVGIAGLLFLGVGSHPAWRYLPGIHGWGVLLGGVMLAFVVFALMTRGNDGADGP